MTYIPKNRITTNLYTNGKEYILSTTSEPYVGYYYKLYTGKVFTGKTQNDSPNIELLPLIVVSPLDPNNVTTVSYTKDTKSIEYSALTKTNIFGVKQLPSTFYPFPTEDDYKLGEFQRYFAKKINESIYIEINKDTYDKLDAKDSMWLWDLYSVIELPWELTGDLKTVYTVNKNTVAQTEQKNKITGLGIYLKNDYLKFYNYESKNNLTAQPGELIDNEGKPYVGPYHIEVDRGYVEGLNPEPRQKRLFLKEFYVTQKRTT